jgi:hypothetical protein
LIIPNFSPAAPAKAGLRYRTGFRTRQPRLTELLALGTAACASASAQLVPQVEMAAQALEREGPRLDAAISACGDPVAGTAMRVDLISARGAIDLAKIDAQAGLPDEVNREIAKAAAQITKLGSDGEDCHARMTAKAEADKAIAATQAALDADWKNFERQQKAKEAAWEAQQRKPGVVIGMTPEQVRRDSSWGAPDHINRTVTAAGTREQWVYGPRSYLYFENGVLTGIQTERR